MDMQLLHQQMTRAIESGEAGMPLPCEQIFKFKTVAKASEHGFLAERRDAMRRIEEAHQNKHKEDLKVACLGWLSNERKFDMLFKAMQWQMDANTVWEHAVIGKLTQLAEYHIESLMCLRLWRRLTHGPPPWLIYCKELS